MQPCEALFLKLMVTNCSGESSFSRFKWIKNWMQGPQYSRRDCPHKAFDTLKALNLDQQIVMNS